jgi:hypothetical protein
MLYPTELQPPWGSCDHALNLAIRQTAVNAAGRCHGRTKEQTSAAHQGSRQAQNHRPAAVTPNWRPLPAFLVVTRRPGRPRAGGSYFFFAPAFLVDFFFVFLAAIYMAPCGDASSR